MLETCHSDPATAGEESPAASITPNLDVEILLPPRRDQDDNPNLKSPFRPSLDLQCLQPIRRPIFLFAALAVSSGLITPLFAKPSEWKDPQGASFRGEPMEVLGP